jgi:hypothetical protein
MDAREMRYRLRTLIIALAVGPVLLSLAYFCGIWAWYALPGVVNYLHPLAMMAIMVMTVVLTLFSLFAPPRDLEDPERVPRWQSLLLGCGEFAALWHGLWFLFSYLGWVWLWGDNQRPGTEESVTWFSAVVAAGLAINVGLRIAMGMGTRTYVRVNAVLIGAILLLVAPLYLAHWLR